MIDEQYLRELMLGDIILFYQQVDKHYGSLSKNFLREIQGLVPFKDYFDYKFLKLNISYKLQFKNKEDYYEKRLPYYREFWKETVKTNE